MLVLTDAALLLLHLQTPSVFPPPSRVVWLLLRRRSSYRLWTLSVSLWGSNSGEVRVGALNTGQFLASFRDLSLFTRKILRNLAKHSSAVLQNRRGSLGWSARHCQASARDAFPKALDKRLRYRNLQRLFSRKTRNAALSILDGREASTCRVDCSVIYETFKNVWSREDRFRGLGGFGGLPAADNSPLRQAFSPGEVLTAIKHIKPDSAAGTDGVKRNALLRWDSTGVKLAHLYNLFLFHRHLPKCLKASRTTLIPKTTDADKLGDIRMWRPLTIGPMLLRALSSIMNVRLSVACPTHAAQWGFVEGQGCAENLMVLEGLFKSSRAHRSPLALVFIDLARAFDSA